MKKTYRSKKRVVEVTCAGVCKKGEVTAIYGKSGIGKSSVLRMIVGLDQPDSGRISYENSNWFSPEVSQTIQQRNCCLVFQDFNLFENMTVEQNLRYASFEDIPEKVLGLAQKLGVRALFAAFPSELSGGQKQQIALLRTLCTQSDVILLDEPFSALDDESISNLISCIETLKKEASMTFVIVTHRMEIVKRLAKSVIKMADGMSEQQDLPNQIYN